MKVLMIDNFDSFTYNLVDELEKLDCEVSIYRNNITMEFLDDIITKNDYKLIVISPGPSSPKNSGICMDIIKKYHSEIPIFGVCLGFQCIVEAFGGVVSVCHETVHGKSSIIRHNDQNIFHQLPNPIHVGRYHSLFASQVPEDFEVAAWYDNIPMAIYHKEYQLSGVQFHPESILTATGSALINNLLRRIDNVG